MKKQHFAKTIEYDSDHSLGGTTHLRIPAIVL
jgi:hypothetical protein